MPERSWNDMREAQLSKEMDRIQADTTKQRIDDRIAESYKKVTKGQKYIRPRLDWRQFVDAD